MKPGTHHIAAAAGAATLAAALSLTVTPARADDGVTEAVEGPGVEVSPGTVLHPNLGAEAGVINNVFFEQSDSGPVTSGVLRISGKLDIASAKIEPEEEVPGEEPGKEPAPQTFTFRAGLAAAYEEYLYYSNPSAAAQRNLTFDGQAHLQVYPAGTWSFLADDRLRRDVRPRNYEDATSTNRIDNNLGLAVRFQPGGHQISGTLRYENLIDVYESTTVANRMNQTIGLRGEWQLFPYTKLYSDLSYGFYGALGEAQPVAGGLVKQSSNPLRFLVGAATALSEPITLKAHVGWTYSPYAMGEGYNAPLLDLEAGYEYSPTGRVVAEYSLDYQDSTNANYFRDHKLTLHVDQQIRRLLLTGGVDVVFRGYRGIDPGVGAPDRDDVILAARVRAQYVLNERYYLTGEYLGSTDQTDYRSMFMGFADDPSYSRNELMFGARAAF